MTTSIKGALIVADVKCYYCGHISGQIFARRNQPVRAGDFVPRKGYTGPAFKPGTRLRCERCHGPVFLEDATNSQPLTRRLRRPEEPRRSRVA